MIETSIGKHRGRLLTSSDFRGSKEMFRVSFYGSEGNLCEEMVERVNCFLLLNGQFLLLTKLAAFGVHVIV